LFEFNFGDVKTEIASAVQYMCNNNEPKVAHWLVGKQKTVQKRKKPLQLNARAFVWLLDLGSNQGPTD
jgi:hypothetical protein